MAGLKFESEFYSHLADILRGGNWKRGEKAKFVAANEADGLGNVFNEAEVDLIFSLLDE